MKLWYVGQVKHYTTKEWELQGVFDSEEKAVAACRNARYFLAAVMLNEELPDGSITPGDEHGFRWAGLDKLPYDEQVKVWPEIFRDSARSSV